MPGMPNKAAGLLLACVDHTKMNRKSTSAFQRKRKTVLTYWPVKALPVKTQEAQHRMARDWWIEILSAGHMVNTWQTASYIRKSYLRVSDFKRISCISMSCYLTQQRSGLLESLLILHIFTLRKPKKYLKNTVFSLCLHEWKLLVFKVYSTLSSYIHFYSRWFSKVLLRHLFLISCVRGQEKKITRVQIKYAQINNTPADKSEFKKELKIQTDEKSYHMSCKFKLLKAS